MDDLQELERLLDETPDEEIPTGEEITDPTGLFVTTPLLYDYDMVEESSAGWDSFFTARSDSFAMQLLSTTARTAEIAPTETNWHTLFTGIGSGDIFTEANALADPFADPLLNPWSNPFPSGTLRAETIPTSSVTGEIDVHAELSRLAALGTTSENDSDNGQVTENTATRRTGASAHIGGAATAMGLMGAGFAPRPAALSMTASGNPGANNMDDLDPPDDLDDGNFALFEEFREENDALLFAAVGLVGIAERTRRVHVTAAAWDDIANAAASIGAQHGRLIGGDAANVASSFLGRVRQSLDTLKQYPEAGIPLPDAEEGLSDIRVFFLPGAVPCDLYYRILPDPDGPEGPEMESILVLRLLPATLHETE
jgi:hypothetical protein